MREILMPYGRGTIRFEVDEARLVGVLEAEHPSAGVHEREIVLDAFENPIGSERLRKHMRESALEAENRSARERLCLK